MSQSEHGDVAYLSREEQIRLWEDAYDRCRKTIEGSRIQTTTTTWCRGSNVSSATDVRCVATWDDIMCWPEATPGETVYLPCPSYINKFKTNEFASRECLPTGQWFVHPVFNKTWTNFTTCLSQEPSPHFDLSLMEVNLPYIRILYHIGYSTSIISLIAALMIMTSYRKLRCPRNLLHANLFVSFVLRALVSLLRDNLLEKGVGLPQDLLYDESGEMSFNTEGMHLECRLLYAVFCFSMVANYAWIFVEGLYLHTLVFVTFYSELSGIWGYVAFGWVCPLAVVCPWIVVRVTLENELCWNTHRNPGYLWIIKAPIAASILINFGFFLNILRILYTKLTLNRISAGGKDLIKRRLAKSILVLIPLFGVPYVVFLLVQEENLHEAVAVVKLYLEMTFNSFNGLVVAILFCFANCEVQTEVRRHLRRLRRQRLSTLNHSTRSARWSSDYGPRRRMVIAAIHPRHHYLHHGRPRTNSMEQYGRHHRLSLNSACSTSRILPEEEEGRGSGNQEELRSGHVTQIKPIAEAEEIESRSALQPQPESRL